MNLDPISEGNFANISFIEEMYTKYKENPSSVDNTWQDFFKQFDLAAKPTEKKYKPSEELSPQIPGDSRIFNLIEGYRTFGHLMADTNPIAINHIEEPWQLALDTFGFTKEDLDQEFATLGILDKERASLKEIIETLKSIYCDKIGIEYMGLQSPLLEKWLQEHIEPSRFKIQLSIEQKQMILQYLNRSELLETFLHTKYVGQKRFSLEGGETLIPMLEMIIEKGTSLGQEEFVIGMAHRGRLNVLSNILKKSYSDLFSEFEEGYIADSFEGSGDVKYHKGFYSQVLTIQGHQVRIILTPNPSHLEAVDPVVEGQVLAKQIQRNDVNKEIVIPILIHGDAALSGQGVVYETIQFSRLAGYGTGGTLHIVINNQIGFTTLPRDARSTNYCTDIARTFGSPVFHVNAEDPEGCIYATLLAIELRHKFHCDVFIDLNCYRKYGHNETDEPAFTQPIEYQLIRKKRPIRELYRDALIQQGVLERNIAESLEQEFKKSLQEAQQQKKLPPAKQEQVTNHSKNEFNFQSVNTGVPLEILQDLTQHFCTPPPEFTIHPKLENLLNDRLAMVKTGSDAKRVDWGMGEFLAYATLLREGCSVRISGQDCGRGTFSHRHGLWMDQIKEGAYFPLQHLKEGQGRFDLINSPLSEYAVLGFEYGYSIAYPESLVIWEAQFGDFCNGAQIIIDQFLATGEQKWGQKSGLVLLLPHGYEGQGPEHSSGRMERFLTLAGNNNMFIVNPTSPLQLFHLFRKHIIGTVRKPLIVFTPKALLRYPGCTNSIEEFTRGSFQEAIDDPEPPEKIKRIAFCSGKVYYDLINERSKIQGCDLAIIRIEQLYPLHKEKIRTLIQKYQDINDYLWVQEEPQNMGAWNFIGRQLQELLPNNKEIKYIGRSRSASPAAGSYALHKKEYTTFMDQVFERNKPSIFELAGNKSKPN